jgi:hypothetical protein
MQDRDLTLIKKANERLGSKRNQLKKREKEKSYE